MIQHRGGRLLMATFMVVLLMLATRVLGDCNENCAAADKNTGTCTTVCATPECDFDGQDCLTARSAMDSTACFDLQTGTTPTLVKYICPMNGEASCCLTSTAENGRQYMWLHSKTEALSTEFGGCGASECSSAIQTIACASCGPHTALLFRTGSLAICQDYIQSVWNTCSGGRILSTTQQCVSFTSVYPTKEQLATRLSLDITTAAPCFSGNEEIQVVFNFSSTTKPSNVNDDIASALNIPTGAVSFAYQSTSSLIAFTLRGASVSVLKFMWANHRTTLTSVGSLANLVGVSAVDDGNGGGGSGNTLIIIIGAAVGAGVLLLIAVVVVVVVVLTLRKNTPATKQMIEKPNNVGFAPAGGVAGGAGVAAVRQPIEHSVHFATTMDDDGDFDNTNAVAMTNILMNTDSVTMMTMASTGSVLVNTDHSNQMMMSASFNNNNNSTALSPPSMASPPPYNPMIANGSPSPTPTSVSPHSSNSPQSSSSFGSGNGAPMMMGVGVPIALTPRQKTTSNAPPPLPPSDE